MKSFLGICVVISTMLVLGTSHPQNYHQRPGYYRDQRWNQEQQPQTYPVPQWPNYQQAPDDLTNSVLHPNQVLDSNNPKEEVKNSSRPYVIISSLQTESNTTSEPSLFTTLIDFIIGEKDMNEANMEETDKTELNKATDDEYLENDEDKIEALFNKDKVRGIFKITSITDTEVKPHSAEAPTEVKISEIKPETKTTNEDNVTNITDDSEETFVILDDDVAATDKKEPFTPISFVTSLVRSTLKGGDNIRELFSEQRVNDFLLRLYKNSIFY